MSDEPRNPYIDPYNYYSGYEESIKKLRENPDFVQFDRLCYETLEGTEIGQKLQKYLIDRFIYPALVHQNNSQFETACVWESGFKAALRMLIDNVKNHAERIKAGEKMNDN